MGGLSTGIISLYFDINNYMERADNAIKAVENAGQWGLWILLGADTNIHSSSFGPKNNRRGEKPNVFIAKYGH